MKAPDKTVTATVPVPKALLEAFTSDETAMMVRADFYAGLDAWFKRECERLEQTLVHGERSDTPPKGFLP